MKKKRTSYFIDIRESKAREKFVNELLSIEGVSLKKHDNKNLDPPKEGMIHSVFPIIVDFETREVDYLRSVTMAACAVGNRKRFMKARKAINKLEL